MLIRYHRRPRPALEYDDAGVGSIDRRWYDDVAVGGSCWVRHDTVPVSSIYRGWQHLYGVRCCAVPGRRYRSIGVGML